MPDNSVVSVLLRGKPEHELAALVVLLQTRPMPNEQLSSVLLESGSAVKVLEQLESEWRLAPAFSGEDIKAAISLQTRNRHSAALCAVLGEIMKQLVAILCQLGVTDLRIIEDALNRSSDVVGTGRRAAKLRRACAEALEVHEECDADECRAGHSVDRRAERLS